VQQVVCASLFVRFRVFFFLFKLPAEREGVLAGFWWGILREGDHSEDPGVDVRMIFKWIFEK
jgi:hypothetical protein